MTNPRYQNALSYLYSFVSYEQKTGWTYSDKTLNLERYRKLLAQLGNPQFFLNPIHVAGSDGKGSTCAMIASALQAMGYKTGQFLSPHLQNIRERITINSQWIDELEFCHLVDYLKDQLKGMPPLPEGYATFFELLTAMAFLYHKEKTVDFSVIETGLGGRLDSTNVMNPLITAITHISLEHTHLLGDTLEKIADEKLGITRPNVPVVIGHQEPDLLPYIRKKLSHHSAPVIFADDCYRIVSHSYGRRYRTVDIENIKTNLKRKLKIPLFGYYQLQNVITALAVMDTLVDSQSIPPFSEKRLQEGMRNVYWPGRFEIVRRIGQPTVILDVAHTAKGTASLRLSLDEIFPNKRRTYVMGFLKGKNIQSMINHLVRPEDRIVLTKAPSPRGESTDNIMQSIDGFKERFPIYSVENKPVKAYQLAKSMVSDRESIIVTGSLYLVGEIRTFLFGERVNVDG